MKEAVRGTSPCESGRKERELSGKLTKKEL